MEFYPANESKLFISIFRWYTRWLFKRRFERVWIRQDYEPDRRSRTIYYLNHHSWWDGLIPFLLNEFRFHQRARAVMEDIQMERYRFFSKIGAFSVNRDDPRGAIRSLRYAVQSMQRERASLFIYPEGKITPPGSPLSFEGGLAWICSKLHDRRVDIVPVGIYMHTMRSDKPELLLRVGTPVRDGSELSNEGRTALFEDRLQSVLTDLRETAGSENRPFERML